MPDKFPSAVELYERYVKAHGPQCYEYVHTDHFKALIEQGKQEMIKDAVRALDFQMCEGCNPAPVWRR